MNSSFKTDGGVVVPTVSVEQMREIDRIAEEHHSPNLYQMMENAGRSLAGLATTRLGSAWSDVPITVFAGPGGNGGGGVAAARHLANRGGDVTLIVSREPTPDTILDQQLGVYAQTSGRMGDSVAAGTGLVIDALIGYGLEDAPRGQTAELISAIEDAVAPVVSLDVPSGLDGDSGHAPGIAVTADQTVTLALPKPGLQVSDAGDIWLADLGIPSGVFRKIGIEVSARVFEEGPVVHLNRSVRTTTEVGARPDGAG